MDKNTSKDYIQTIGRRREAVARVRLYKDPTKAPAWNDNKLSKGQVIVNGMPADKYFSLDSMKSVYEEPIKVVNALDKYGFTIKVDGGGLNGQLNASVHGIARALAEINEEFKPVLRKNGFLTRDSRTRQRRMVGMGGKSRRKMQSPKR